MIVLNSDKYVESYWMIDGVVECCELENIQNENLSHKEIKDIYEESFKKLNNNINTNNGIESINGNESYMSNNPRTYQTDRRTTNRKNKNKQGISRGKIRTMRECTGEEADQYIIIQKTINGDNNKRKVYKMPEKSRLQEYRERRCLLLDPFTKPRIIDKN
jgi:hypothetical protein